jgi:putative hydrolase of the HAD superfamily
MKEGQETGETAITVVGFDFFGTLVDAQAETHQCIHSICQTLHHHAISLSPDEFMQTYRAVASDLREVRRTTQQEVSNRSLLVETLKRLGYPVDDQSPPIVEGVEAYFKPWRLAVYEDAWRAIEGLRSACRFGLVSNFTDTLFLRSALQRLGLEGYFESVVVSEEVGWRKPHPRIFNRFLQQMGVDAGAVLFVGDDLQCDIVGAKKVGMKTAWIARDPARAVDEEVTAIRPDFIIHSLEQLETLVLASPG